MQKNGAAFPTGNRIRIEPNVQLWAVAFPLSLGPLMDMNGDGDQYVG